MAQKSKMRCPTPQTEMFGLEDCNPEVRFIQIISVSYSRSDGSESSSVVALGADGIVYQYHRGDINAWVPFNTDIFRRV